MQVYGGPLGIAGNEKKNVSISASPIPAVNELNVITEGISSSEKNIRIVNEQGSTIRELPFKKDLVLDISSLENGIYFIVVPGDHVSFEKKFTVIK